MTLPRAPGTARTDGPPRKRPRAEYTLPPDVLAALRERAAASGEAASQIVERALREHLDLPRPRTARTDDDAARAARAADAADIAERTARRARSSR